MNHLNRAAAAIALMSLAGCSAVKMSRTREDWEKEDRQKVKRLVVVTTPLAAGDQKVSEMWSALAARHVDLKRNFIIKDKAVRADGSFDAASYCIEGVDGVLRLSPVLLLKGSGAEATVKGSLVRCGDLQEDWIAEAAGSWRSQEPKLEETIKDYVAEFGPTVEPYVAASYYVLKAALDTLPDTVLTEEDQSEKIENVQ
jgi:probable lipoprotein (TIGR04455 family)